MFFIILFYGVSYYKLKASFLFLIYSLLSSVFILFSFFISYFNQFNNLFNSNTLLLISCLLIAFFIKLPLVPFHSWLIEAHAESSTMGSIILASGILKLAIYGIYRFLLVIINNYNYFKLIIIVLSIISIFYIIFNIQRLVNLKQIIASSSIIHISLGLIGLININNKYLYLGGLLILIHHSILSCYFFFICGELSKLTNSLDITIIKSIFN